MHSCREVRLWEVPNYVFLRNCMSMTYYNSNTYQHSTDEYAKCCFTNGWTLTQIDADCVRYIFGRNILFYDHDDTLLFIRHNT